MGVEIHRSLVSWATINRKDVTYTLSFFSPWLISGFFFFLHYVVKELPSLVYTAMILLALVPVGLLCYEPAILVFPTNIITSCLLRDRPPNLTNEMDRLFVNASIFTDPATFEKIQKEILDIQADHIPKMKDALPHQHYIGSEEKWRYLAIRTMGCTHSKNAEQLPSLMKAIEGCPEVLTMAVSRLDGGGHIPPHAGYFKGIVRYHLGISVPESDKCSITVHDQELHWEEGKAIMFDDMYLHSVTHNGSKPRVILWFDIFRFYELRQWPLWLKWNRWLVEIISKSRWMEEANRRTETVVYSPDSIRKQD
jgi:hypothetical protein